MVWSGLSGWVRRSQQQLLRYAWGAGTITFFVLLKTSGALQTVELSQLDWLIRQRPDEPIDSRILIIAIDQPFLDSLAPNSAGITNLEYEDLAQLTRLVWAQKPVAVGLDIVSTRLSGKGQEELITLFKEHEGMIGIEKAFPPSTPPLAGIADEQLAFNDFSGDADGKIRRAFLGFYVKNDNTFKKSLSLRLAELYLFKKYGISSQNGLRDRETARFDAVEIPRLRSTQELYAGARNLSEDGVQTLIHFRQQPEAFPSISAQAIMDGSADLSLIRDKIVLVGITAPAIAPYLTIPVPRSKLAQSPALQGEVFGVELQAHATSQIVSAVLDDRLLLQGIHQRYSYGLIVLFGIVGTLIGCSSVNLKVSLLSLGFGIVFSLLSFWLLFFYDGLYIFPRFSLLTLIFTGVGYTIIVQREMVAKEVLERKAAERKALANHVELMARQRAIEDTFGEIHNGPLQLLSLILRQIQDGETSIVKIEMQLVELNQNIRQIGDHLKQEAKAGSGRSLLRLDQKFNLAQPLHELFYDIYYQSLQMDWPNLKQLKVKSRVFEPLPGLAPSEDDKSHLCRFLEEALLNVAKHGEGTTRLTVTGRVSQKSYVLTIEDNGLGLKSQKQGAGSKIGIELERRLNGKFDRVGLQPQGVRCSFAWPLDLTSED